MQYATRVMDEAKKRDDRKEDRRRRARYIENEGKNQRTRGIISQVREIISGTPAPNESAANIGGW